VRQAVLGAALGVLLDEGVEGFSIAAVALRAGVHETSIYRRWSTRENLIVDAMLANSAAAIPIPDTGSVREDLIWLVRAVATLLSQPAGVEFARAVALCVEDEALAGARREFWQSRTRLASAIIERGIRRGELPPHTDARLVLETVIAPLHMRALLTHTPLSEDLPEKLVDLVLGGAVSGGAVSGGAVSGGAADRR
jgi:AcrR family transcriptional regulator